MVFYKYN